MLPNKDHLLRLVKERREVATLVVSVVVGTLLLVISHQLPQHSAAVSGDIDAHVQMGDVVMQPPDMPRVVVPELRGVLRDPATFDAAGILVRDVESKSVLYKKGEYTKRPIASITKLMTALTLLDFGMPWADTAVVVDDTDLIDNHMYAGDTYSVEDLWLSMLVASSNKAAMTLVDLTAPNREAFVLRMNELAAQYGMVDTTFVEPTGLNEGNISTPDDIATLLDRALAESSIRDGLRTPEHQIYSAERDDAHHMWNTNWLLLGWIPHQFYHIIGGKTGYIEASLYNFTARTVTVDGKVLDVIVFGAPIHEARFTEARDAVRAVLDAYEWGNESL